MVSELLDTDMGQNNSEAQSNTLTTFLQDLSSHADLDGACVLRTNVPQEGGTLVLFTTDP